MIDFTEHCSENYYGVKIPGPHPGYFDYDRYKRFIGYTPSRLCNRIIELEQQVDKLLAKAEKSDIPDELRITDDVSVSDNNSEVLSV